MKFKFRLVGGGVLPEGGVGDRWVQWGWGHNKLAELTFPGSVLRPIHHTWLQMTWLITKFIPPHPQERCESLQQIFRRAHRPRKEFQFCPFKGCHHLINTPTLKRKTPFEYVHSGMFVKTVHPISLQPYL